MKVFWKDSEDNTVPQITIVIWTLFPLTVLKLSKYTCTMKT